jgi:hypothetical protein
MQFLIIILYQPPLTSCFFPNILLSPLFSKTLSLCYYINVADHVSDLNKTRDKINVTPPTKCILLKKNQYNIQCTSNPNSTHHSIQLRKQQYTQHHDPSTYLTTSEAIDSPP